LTAASEAVAARWGRCKLVVHSSWKLKLKYSVGRVDLFQQRELPAGLPKFSPSVYLKQTSNIPTNNLSFQRNVTTPTRNNQLIAGKLVFT
jgi:hypothetical protein